MKIQHGDLIGIQTAKPDKPAEASEVGRSGGLGEGRGNLSSDQVELSDLTSRLAQALQADAAQRINRVRELSERYQAGLYRADPVAVSRALLREAAAERPLAPTPER